MNHSNESLKLLICQFKKTDIDADIVICCMLDAITSVQHDESL